MPGEAHDLDVASTPCSTHLSDFGALIICEIEGSAACEYTHMGAYGCMWAHIGTYVHRCAYKVKGYMHR